MPDGNGHWHRFKLPSNAVVTGEHAACGHCLLTRDARVHGVPLGAKGDKSSDETRSFRLVKCPECGASVGQACISQSTYRPIQSPHARRKQRAESSV